MKILIAGDTYPPSVNGAAYFTYRLATLLAKRGHQVAVIAPSRTLQNTISFEDGVTVYGVRSIAVPIYQGFRVSPSFLVKQHIKGIMETFRPDVVHVQSHFMISATVLAAARKYGIPTVGTNHFMPENLVYYLRAPRRIEERIKSLGWKHFMRVYGRLDSITTPTQTAADLVRNLGFTREIRVISCGIDTERFHPSHDGTALKKRYGIPEDRPVLLYLGRLDEEKRIETILQAFEKVIKKTPAHLVLAGTGKLREPLEMMAEALGITKHVTFTGFVPDADLTCMYRAADCFVIAGIAELQSIVTMEALASGLPVVAVRAVALPELVHDGENGYLFENDDYLGLAERLTDVLSHPALRARMGIRSREIIAAHDIRIIIDRYESVYREAVGG